MASYNHVALIGNITKDIEVRFTPKGSAVCDLSIAVNRKYKTDNGETREEVTFVEITAFGKTAELAGQYLRRGAPVFIEGRLTMDTWEDKQTGQKRSKLKVICENLQFLGSKQDGEQRQGNERQNSSKPPTRSGPPKRQEEDFGGNVDDFDEVPF